MKQTRGALAVAFILVLFTAIWVLAKTARPSTHR
jgi:hypothetical protein